MPKVGGHGKTPWRDIAPTRPRAAPAWRETSRGEDYPIHVRPVHPADPLSRLWPVEKVSGTFSHQLPRRSSIRRVTIIRSENRSRSTSYSVVTCVGPAGPRRRTTTISDPSDARFAVTTYCDRRPRNTAVSRPPSPWIVLMSPFTSIVSLPAAAQMTLLRWSGPDRVGFPPAPDHHVGNELRSPQSTQRL